MALFLASRWLPPSQYRRAGQGAVHIRRSGTVVPAALLTLTVRGPTICWRWPRVWCCSPAAAQSISTASNRAHVPSALAGLEQTPLLQRLDVKSPARASATKIIAVGFGPHNNLGDSYTTPQDDTVKWSRQVVPGRSGDWTFTSWLTGVPPPTPEKDGPNHRGYQAIQFERAHVKDCASPCLSNLWVWLDTRIPKIGEWFSLETLALDASVHWSRVVTVNVGYEGYLNLAHVPTASQQVMPYQSHRPFPMRRWVRLTTYIDARPGHGVVAVWQDGRLAVVSGLDGWPGGKIPQAHFGLYSPSEVLNGQVINDGLTFWTLAKR